MTEILEYIGKEGYKVHVLIGRSMKMYVLEDVEGMQITLMSDELKDLAKIVRKYEEVDE